MTDKETVIVSLCAFGVPCRMHGQYYAWNGVRLYRQGTEDLREDYHVLPLCGAIMGGLPTPRPECEVKETPDGLRVIGRHDPSIDYTDQYNKGAQEVLNLAKMFNVKKAYLLEKCPMCGKNYGILARLLEKNGIRVCNIPSKKSKSCSRTGKAI